MKKMLYLLLFVFSFIFILSCSSKTVNGENKRMAKNENLIIDENIQCNTLTEEEQSILLSAGTERPFSGELLYNKEEGLYLCKRCNNILFQSDTKFDSKSGWPSFDESVEGSIKYVKDGSRTEVLCAKCGGHLGHVFYGEGFNEKNARYCVNSLSLNFEPDKNDGENN